MTDTLFKLVGGIGLFLLGMVLLTDGIKAFAGEALRRALVRFTGTPLKAFGSGALVTVLVQSSSATTVAVIGFVSAGLLTFPQAVGVVFGASLGTTGTGWIVSTLGLKISIGLYALPLVGIGAFVRLLGRGRWQALGPALGGFGLIFLGIDTLQAGMQGIQGRVDLAALPSEGFAGHLLMLLIGAFLTVVMQSSSAAVATTLTALHTGSITFEQAAAVVIGAAIGTTITGALAAIGGSVPAKRTALAHIGFNLATGLIALALLPWFLRGIVWAQANLGLDPGATSLAAFHTAFIALGVLIFLPFVHGFSRAIERLLPDRGPALTRHLDPTLLNVPSVAVEASLRAVRDASAEALEAVAARLRPDAPDASATNADELVQAVKVIQDFVAQVPPAREDEPMTAGRVRLFHALDHLARLLPRITPPSSWLATRDHALLRSQAEASHELLTLAARGLRGEAGEGAAWLDEVERRSLELSQQRRDGRRELLRQTADGASGPAPALDGLDAMRWLDRLGYHAWRLCNYAAGDGRPEPARVAGVAHPDQ
jgi:phosphate:Na+ symporter